MILYFSGTGNSEYVAKRIGKVLNHKVMNLFSKIRSHDFSKIHSNDPWVIVVPTYAWRIPKIVHKWLEKTTLVGNKHIYFVMTCGGNIGNAGNYLKKLCTAKNLKFCGCMSILMPENYIAMFSTPTQEDALETIHKSESIIDKTAILIKNNQPFLQPSITFKDRISSGVVNDIFYPMYVHAKKFYASNTCISCGLCVKVCPMSNIHLENGKPVWGKCCTHCMACICRCPSQAIEYGNHSKGMTRYICPKNI